MLSCVISIVIWITGSFSAAVETGQAVDDSRVDNPGRPQMSVDSIPWEQHAVRRIAAKSIAVVLVAHDMKLVMKISDRILVLEGGRPLAEGTPREVRDNPAVLEAYLGKHRAGEAARA